MTGFHDDRGRQLGGERSHHNGTSSSSTQLTPRHDIMHASWHRSSSQSGQHPFTSYASPIHMGKNNMYRFRYQKLEKCIYICIPVPSVHPSINQSTTPSRWTAALWGVYPNDRALCRTMDIDTYIAGRGVCLPPSQRTINCFLPP